MNDEAAIELLRELVAIRSHSGEEAEATAFLAGRMAALGLGGHVDGAGNAVGLAGEAGPLVVLLGHIDTVPGGPALAVRENRLYGRGTVDAKGPLATFVCAAARLVESGRLRCRLAIVGAVEEEAASSKGAHFVVDKYAPDFCVIGEPSGWERITLGYKGRLLVRYERSQPMAHTAGEARAVAEHAVDFWRAVQARAEAHNAGKTRLFDQILPSLRAFNTGGDGMSDWAQALIGLRLPEDVDPYALAEELGALGAGATLRFEGHCPAFRADRNNALCRALLKSIRAGGGQPGFLLKTGTADMNVVGPAWGCPIVAYGPGDSSLDHTPEEHVELAEYLRAIEVLADALAALAP
jgi:[amino group carrier protein]-lysine/ornithine hydrolase